jgi:5-methylcytosine-specific restriction endonuclease McrA
MLIESALMAAHFNRLVQALPVCLLVKRQFTQRQALLVLLRDQWTCQLCGERLTRQTAQIDHVIPWSRGGTTSVLNAQALCQRCNLSKGASLNETQTQKVAARCRATGDRALQDR